MIDEMEEIKEEIRRIKNAIDDMWHDLIRFVETYNNHRHGSREPMTPPKEKAYVNTIDDLEEE
ncbi:MAG: hypothetical protein QW222_04320 [Candidatus Bathyarchaeia archaeon]